MGLVDLHCHILPGLDDGAADEADAVAMARQAALDGIAVICATPHIRDDHDVRIEEIAGRVSAVNAVTAQASVAVEVVPGGEVAEAALDEISDAELALVSFGGHGRWVLVEPAPGPIGAPLHRAVEGLGDRGVRAVIAHPERHLGDDYRERLTALVGLGALVQVTAAHVLDDGAGPVLTGLARAGLVHLVGSDAHSSRWGRPVAVREAIDRMTAEAGEPVGAFMADAPAALLRGEDVEPPVPAASTA